MPKGGSVRKPSPVKTNPTVTRPATWSKPGSNPQPGTVGKPSKSAA